MVKPVWLSSEIKLQACFYSLIWQLCYEVRTLDYVITSPVLNSGLHFSSQGLYISGGLLLRTYSRTFKWNLKLVSYEIHLKCAKSHCWNVRSGVSFSQMDSDDFIQQLRLAHGCSCISGAGGWRSEPHMVTGSGFAPGLALTAWTGSCGDCSRLLWSASRTEMSLGWQRSGCCSRYLGLQHGCSHSILGAHCMHRQHDVNVSTFSSILSCAGWTGLCSQAPWNCEPTPMVPGWWCWSRCSSAMSQGLGEARVPVGWQCWGQRCPHCCWRL